VIGRWWFALALLFVYGCTVQADLGGSSVAEAVATNLALPIEVLGSGAPDEPVIVSAELSLSAANVSAVETLYVQCHRCGFYGPPEFEALNMPLTTVKASLRIDGGGTSSDAPWLDVTDGNVTVDPAAAAHGGINGGYVTLGFHVSIDAATRARLVAAPARNTLEFRFNGSDGISNGFRILDVQFQDESGRNLSPVVKQWADIASEKAAGAIASSASAVGKALWTGQNQLQKSVLVTRTIRAACSDCHAADGRDLQYFNYSDNAIVQRSRFYGLTETQGQAIAAYLRSSLASVPHVAAAAPWNPPYQPGPGLDERPAVEWAAGAGLDTVLANGSSFVPAFAGEPGSASALSVTQTEVSMALDPTRTQNTRETALPLALPDWNAWLPVIHPLDIWPPVAPATTGIFETGYQGQTPLAAYGAIEAWFAANPNSGAYADWSALSAAQRNQIQNLLEALGGQVLGFGGGGQGSRVSADPNNPYGVELGAETMQALLSSSTAALADLTTCGPIGPCTPFSTESFIERANLGLYHWFAVKQWEVVEGYGLQVQPAFHGSVDSSGNWVGQGEARGWPYSWPSVFYLAPRTLYAPESTAGSTRAYYFSWENRLVSYYRTNQWDELQVVLAAGWPGASNGAVDWPSNLGSITALADDLISANAPAPVTAAHLARYFANAGKLAQLANTDLPFDAPAASDPTNLYANAGMQSKADLLFKLSPAILLDSDAATPSRFRLLDQIAPGLYLLFVNGMLSSYDTLFTGTARSQYRLCDPNNTQLGGPEPSSGMRFCIDAARTPLPIGADGLPYCPYPADNGFTTEQYSVWGAGAASRQGADASLVQRWSDWNDRMWPN
jgi:hypothetical protein